MTYEELYKNWLELEKSISNNSTYLSNVNELLSNLTKMKPDEIERFQHILMNYLRQSQMNTMKLKQLANQIVSIHR